MIRVRRSIVQFTVTPVEGIKARFSKDVGAVSDAETNTMLQAPGPRLQALTGFRSKLSCRGVPLRPGRFRKSDYCSGGIWLPGNHICTF